jgi:Protein of unknown function (DUF3606)
MDELCKNSGDNRGHINMKKLHEVHCWTRQLGVSHEELQRLVDRVGSSAATVRKEIAAAGARNS